MKRVVRTLIFLLSRHPLTVVGAVLICAMSVFLKVGNYSSWLEIKKGHHPPSTNGSTKHYYYAYPMELRMKQVNVIHQVLRQRAANLGFTYLVGFGNQGPSNMAVVVAPNRLSSSNLSSLSNSFIPTISSLASTSTPTSTPSSNNSSSNSGNLNFPTEILPPGFRLIPMDAAINQLWKLLQSGRRVEVTIFIGGVLGMAYCLVSMFRNFRRIGSMFSLGCCAMVVAALDLLFALEWLRRWDIPVRPLLLLEFGPYFIMAVGFRKSYRLAKSIYGHRRGKGDIMGLICGVEECGPRLFLEYTIEMGLFGLFSLSDVAGLREFSLLCVAMLAADAIILMTFFLGMVAFRLRLHASRAATHQQQSDTMEGLSNWGWVKLVVTLILLALYSLNVLQSLSAQNEVSLSWLSEQIAGGLDEKSMMVMPMSVIVNATSPIDQTSSLPPGAMDVVGEVLRKLFFLPSSPETTSLKTLLQVSLFLALPISLMANYFLYRILRKYQKLIIRRQDYITAGSPKSCPLINSTASLPPKFSSTLDDSQVLELLKQGQIQLYALESLLKVNPNDSNGAMRAVRIRRQFLQETRSSSFKNETKVDARDEDDSTDDNATTNKNKNNNNNHTTQDGDFFNKLPLEGVDYGKISEAHCENVVGFVPIPVGVAGPLLVDDISYWIPLATTEGALVASINRGMKAISYGGGANTALLADGMSRGPVISLLNLEEAIRVVKWIKDNFWQIQQVFNSSSRFVRLQRIDSRPTGKLVYLRFVAQTGEAMGMNMVSKGTENALALLKYEFPTMRVIALSGNYCSDKKAAAINWIQGRGKSVVAEAIIPEVVIKNVLKTTSRLMVEANTAKNLVGSALAGSMGGGGCNGHAANVITAMFIALGQDPAQVISSSSCLTFMEEQFEGGVVTGDLYVSVTMPSIEVGTIGGGTRLAAQQACLKILQLDQVSSSVAMGGEMEETEGGAAARLARIMAAAVLAGEISLLASLTEGTLVKAHMNLNRPTSDVSQSN